MGDVSLGLAHEAELKLRNAGATQENFWNPIVKIPQVAEKLVAFLSSLLTPFFRLVAGFDRDMTKEKWELVSDTEIKEGEFVPEFVEFLKDGENYVNGDEMVKRTEHKNNGGQRAAEAMLRDQNKIPEACREYILVFPKTLWRDSDRNQRVPFLYWNDSEWCLHFFWLDDDFYGYCRVVRLGK